MDQQQVSAELMRLGEILQDNDIQSPAYREASEAYDKLFLGHVTLRDLRLIKDYLPQPIPDDIIALLISTVMNGHPITDVVHVPAPIQCALLVRWGRKQKGFTQAELAEQLDMTQSQIAKIESAANGVTAEVMGKLAKALDITFTITPNDPVMSKTSPKKAS
ncbi:helix-turn-helix domain-containing protein [Lacticaseibacillus porcinae]|uniref:helix-turn-helix domain-containing protein n=1 Tax=Lacticaseibacillus porcinae TaxID=1123687 RepID=UPI000F774371|nr:helix-turn-helix transcriptional regulator [Lacticaseibacillus porcinae]